MSFRHTLTASLIMIAAFGLFTFISHAENIQPNKPFSTFPKQLEEWVGKEDHFDEEIYEILGVDDSFLANYHTPDGRHAELYVGFYQSQRQGDIIHSPLNCLPGAGWKIERKDYVELPNLASKTGKMKAVLLYMKKNDQKQIVVYWFQSRGRFISSEYMQKIYLVIDSITQQRTDGSFVRLISPVPNNDESLALENIKEFAKSVIPILNEYIPS